MKKILLLALLLISFFSARSQPNVNDSHTIYDLGEGAWLLKPSAYTKDIGSAIKSDDYYKSSANVINFGISKHPGWLKTRITGKESQDSYLLIEQSRLVDPECYFVFDNGLIRKIGLIAIKDVANQEWPGTGFFAKLPKVAQSGSYQIFIKLMSHELIVTTVKVGRKNSFSDQLITKELLFGLYSGIMFVMLIYNLFLYMSVRDRSYLYYVFYILSIWLTQISIAGFSAKYLWPNNGWLGLNSVTLFSSFTGVMAFIFIKEFLNIDRKKKPLISYIYFNLFTFSISLVLLLSGEKHIAFIVMQLATFVGSLFALYIAFIVYKSGFAPAKYFLIAWSLLLIGACLFIMKDYTIIPYNNYTIYILQIASAAEVTLLSFALADKINIFKKEKEESQAEALRISLENEKLILGQNVELERKVHERTLELQQSNEALEVTLNDLKEAQSQLVDSEKMAGLGQLTAGIAHEINNPINFVTSNIKPLELDIIDLDSVINMYEKLDFDADLQPQIAKIESFKRQIDLAFVRDEIKSLLSGISEGAKRTAEIIKSLKNFSRLDENDTKPVDLNEGLASTLVLVKNTFPDHLSVITEYGSIPNVECLPGKINQVFMNLISNAVHAIKNKEGKMPGILKLKSWEDGDNVKISISDTGTGMPEEVRQKIFEPFFTTKDVGEGTGLGLSIVFRIIESHKGTIDVVTKVGEGTEFIITLPVNSQ